MESGRTLGLTDQGSSAAILEPGGVHLVALRNDHRATYHALPGATDVVAVGPELWVAAGGRLYQFGSDHRLRRERELSGGAGLLRPCAAGVPGALWSEAPQAVLLADGATSAMPVDAATDCVVPVTATRWIASRRDRIQLRDPGVERWSVTLPIPGRVLDGAVLFGGRTVALVAGTEGVPAHLFVLSLRDGAVHHRMALAGIDRVRFAAIRGLALMRASADTLVLVDLRFGQVLKEHREERPIVDATLDASGQQFMVRFDTTHEDVSIGSIRDMLAASERVSVPAFTPPPEPATASAPSPGAEVEPPPAPPPFHQGQRPLPTANLLAPRPRLEVAPPVHATLVLERYREYVSAMASAAIARAWDEGRLSPRDNERLPFLAEVDGLRGRTSGRAPDKIAEAAGEVAQAVATLRTQEASLGTAPPPLAAMSAEFELSAVAQLILLVVAAPTLWGELARLYGVLSNDAARPLVDEQPVGEILALHARRYDITRELDRDAPLVRHGLVQAAADKPRPFAPLLCDPIVLRLLRGADYEVELADLRIIRGDRSFDDLLIPAALKDDLARRIEAAPRQTAGRLVVRGRSGAGRHALIATLAGTANRAVAVIDATMIVRDLRRRGDELVSALRRAHLAGMLPCVDGLEAIPGDDPGARDLTRRLLAEHPGPLAVRLPLDVDPALAPGYLGVDLPALTMEQRTACWRLQLAEHGLVVRDPDELADRYGVGPGVIARVCQQIGAAPAAGAQAAAEAAVAAPTDAPVEADASLALELAIRQHLEAKLRATATRVERLATWSRVILPPDIQESVLELIARIKHRRTVYDRWGMGDILTTARGVTALFQGGPGTGKTLVASAIANELGMDLYRVDLSRIMSKWIGETEQNLAKLFDAAEDGHTIILFDEADSLFAKRTEVRSSVDRYANLEVNYLLQRLDSFEGIAILTTNFGTAIDNAFKRRLSFRLTFPFPDEDAREALWRTHLPAQLPRSGDFDLAELARRYRLSGGYIRNAALRAAFLAAEEHAPLTHDHLERAIKAEFREIGKIAESGILE